MRTYIGKKEVKARPITLKEAEEILGKPVDGQGEECGYLVHYPDGHVGYYPETIFERDFSPAETVLDRVILEAKELKERFDKLCAFVDPHDEPGLSDAFMALDNISQCLLIDQRRQMKEYYDILLRRIGILMTK